MSTMTSRVLRYCPFRITHRKRVLFVLVLTLFIIASLMFLQMSSVNIQKQFANHNFLSQNFFRPTIHTEIQRNSAISPHHPIIRRFNNHTRINQTAISINRTLSIQFNHLYYNVSNIPPELTTWWQHEHISLCDGAFVGLGHETAILNDVILDNTKIIGLSGGEDFYDLMNQKEEKEFLKYQNGFLQMICGESSVQYKFKERNHNNEWMSSLRLAKKGDIEINKCNNTISQHHIAITRYEYVNLYHTMTDFYNAFLVMNLFNLTQAQTNILIVDGHPWGGLDSVWGTLFNSMQRVKHLPECSLFNHLIFGMQGYNSLLFRGVNDQSIKEIPLHEEFRDFFLTSYGLPTHRPLNCQNISMLFIWRRPYMAHPRNPSGDVWRKIHNEEELLTGVQKKFPQFLVRGVQLDSLEMRDQLRYVAETDIMIGMHGAALSLSLLLPQGRTLIELMPKYVTPAWKGHFIVMAKWRSLVYQRWWNEDASLEYPDHVTKVPPEVVIPLIMQSITQMCGVS